MKVIFSDRSRARLHEIQSYVAFHNIRAAVQVIDRILYTTELLADHPHLGTLWRAGKTRALVVSGLPYRIHYRVDDARKRIIVITVSHTSRKEPELRW